MALSDAQRVALANLADKKAGHDVNWISIADARALTDLGMAKRNPGGWEITPLGEAELGQSSPAVVGLNVVRHRPPG